MGRLDQFLEALFQSLAPQDQLLEAFFLRQTSISRTLFDSSAVISNWFIRVLYSQVYEDE